MHDSACLTNPITNAYCFLSAVQNTNPSDFDFFSLPLGIPLPKTATPTCSGCSKSLMGIYASALQDPSQAALLTGLKSTYQVSAQIAVQLCGAAFAVTSISAAISLSCGWPTIFSGFIFPLTWMVLAHVAWYMTCSFDSHVWKIYHLPDFISSLLLSSLSFSRETSAHILRVRLLLFTSWVCIIYLWGDVLFSIYLFSRCSMI